MGSWGTELWDRYSCVLTHVTRGGDELVSVYAKYVKERGDLEREYARNVKKLVSKYTQKTQTRQGIETTQGKGFRWEIIQSFSELSLCLQIAASGDRATSIPA